MESVHRLEAPGVTVIQPSGPAGNPYVRLLVEHLAREAGVTVVHYTGPDTFRGGRVWHLHWPEHVLRAGNFVTALVGCVAYLLRVRYARLRGTRIVWTLHNIHSHDIPWPRLDTWFRARLCRLLHGWITMSRTVQAAAEEAYPVLKTKPAFHIPHGHYRGSYPDEVTRAEARRKLEITPDARVVLFFGSVRPYKNVVHLQRVFRALHDPLARLLIAGPCYPNALEAEVLGSVRRDSRSRAWLTRIPDAEVQWYYRAADLVVLPFKAVANSGSAMLALSFGVPLLVPNLGSMEELSEYAGDEWVRTFEGELSPEVLAEALIWATETPRGEKPVLQGLDWQRIAARTARCYRVLLDGIPGAALRKVRAAVHHTCSPETPVS
jgi:beta-1,4-mannosyltransferase